MATSKRASGTKSESEMKRAKLDECVAEYEVVLGGEMYVIVDMLFNCAELHRFFKKEYAHTIKAFIAKAKLQAVNVTRKNVANGVLCPKDKYATKTDFYVVKKDELIVDIIASAKKGSYPSAPAVIKDKDLTFFKDKADTSYRVEMRGKRTMDGIYFKAKDVSVVLESEWLVNSMLRDGSTYHELIDYVRFAMQKPGPKQRVVSDTSEQGHIQKSDTSLQERKRTYNMKQDVFLTCKGLLKAYFVTQALACRQPYGDIYLIHLGDRLYKFGKSSNIEQRVKDHEAYFNGAGYDDIEHVYSAKVDINKLSAAELAVKKFLQASNWYRSTRLSTELCELGDGDLEQVKYFYDQLQARDFSGVPYSPPVDVWKSIVTLFESLGADDDMLLGLKQPVTMPINAPKHAEEIQDSKCACELHIKDLETQIEKLRYENAQLKAAAEIGALQQIIEAQSSRIRRLEELTKVKILCPWVKMDANGNCT